MTLQSTKLRRTVTVRGPHGRGGIGIPFITRRTFTRASLSRAGFCVSGQGWNKGRIGVASTGDRLCSLVAGSVMPTSLIRRYPMIGIVDSAFKHKEAHKMSDYTFARFMVEEHLCPDCVHQKNCVEPRITEETDKSGITCMAFRAKPEAGGLSQDHIDALPDRDPCSECVTRKGTIANNQHHDTERFRQCLEDRTPFLCGHGGDTGRICGGWLAQAKRGVTQ